MFNHVFGPVPSRRLGMSLGIDLVPYKICSFDCVYCECGPTTNRTLERKEYVTIDEVIKELQYYLNIHPLPDYITLSGAGEPTLNVGFGDVISYAKTNYPNLPMAVLTNGSLLYDKQVRNELLNANVILPSLDAAVKNIFNRINHPDPVLTIETYIQGLIDLRKEFKGAIWLEVMIIPGYNDGDENLFSIKDAILRIKPDKIQLNTLDRPGVVDGLRAAKWHELQRIIELWRLDNVEVIGTMPERKDIKSYRKNIENAIVETITRRPCTLDDLNKILGIHNNEINKYLGVLVGEGIIKTIRAERGLFYQVDF
ncbi:MAG: radical SAM protein [Marinilabiliaceae bacterium]|nr:radical SAM protein [Marinilabiliaceae bacterium]